MTSIHQSELESNATDSVASSPRSDHHFHLSHDLNARVRLMCSFGGKILPRPHDNQLRYVGGETRIVAVQRSTTFTHFLSKLAKLSGTINMTIKYQLPNEDLDALISVTTDEDVENMMDEYDRLVQNHQNPKSARLRLFLFPKGDQDSRAGSINSLFGGSTNRDHWFLDALNGGAPASELERGRSEASSIISEVPDYLFGLDNQDDAMNQPREPKMKSRFNPSENVSVSDPGSPAPVVSSPFCSTSSATCVTSMPNLPPVKTRPETPSPRPEMSEKQPDQNGFAENREPAIPFSQPAGYPSNPMMHYFPGANYSGHQPLVYFVPGQIPPGNVPVQPIPMQTPSPYVQQYPGVGGGGQIPVAYHHPVTMAGQVYGGGMTPVSNYDPLEAAARMVPPDGINQQQMYYGVQNTAMAPPYPGMMAAAADELRGSGMEMKAGRVSP